MKYFTHFSHYLSFVAAKDFVQNDRHLTRFCYQKNKRERLGHWLVQPLLYPLDKIMINSRNPAMILGLTVIAIFATLALFFPSKIVKFISPKVISRVKLGLYSLTQMTIAGLGLRTLGRLANKNLMSQWKRQEIATVGIGSIKI